MGIKTEYRRRNPWAKTQKNILVRIKHSKLYKGIKNYLTTKDLKMLWFRDKAYLMEIPSIDRLDSSKDYTVDNCRYIEFINNVTKTFGRWSIKHDKCTNCETTEVPHNAKGHCKKCYWKIRRERCKTI